MSVLRNARQERFAQEIAAGKNATGAYRLAGYKASRAHACELAQDANVRGRVEELLAERITIDRAATELAIERTGITKAAVIQMLLDDRALAHAGGHPAAAVRAAELLGKEIGMFIDRKEIKRVDEFENMTEADLRTYITEGLGLKSGSRTRH